MSTRPEPLVIVSRPCPGKAPAVERLVAGTLEEPDREALERHIRACRRCQGYRDWLRLEARTARSLARQRPRRIMLDQVRRDLEQRIARMRATEAAQALVHLAEWYIARREDPDSTLSLGPSPRGRKRLAEQVSSSVQRLASSPWNRTQTSRAQQALISLETIERIPRRSAGRLLLDLAIEVEDHSYRAHALRGYVIREEGFAETGLLEQDWETLMASDDSRWQAQALSQRASHYSIVEEDLSEAMRLEAAAHRLTPQAIGPAFNLWFLSLLARSRSDMRRHQRIFQEALKNSLGSPRFHRIVLPSIRAVLSAARHDGHVTQKRFLTVTELLDAFCGD